MAHLAAIGLDEILLAVLQESDNQTLAQCIIVSRSWNELASRVLWRDMPSMFPLLQLLGLKVVDIRGLNFEEGAFHEHYYWDFEEPPSADQWERWSVYAPKVRRVRHTDRFSVPTMRPEATFEVDTRTEFIRTGAFAFLGTKQAILPHLEILEWEPSIPAPSELDCLLPFICPSLRTLILPFVEEDEEEEDAEQPRNHQMALATRLMSTLLNFKDLRLKRFGLGCLSFTAHTPATYALTSDLLENSPDLLYLEVRADHTTLLSQELPEKFQTLASTLNVLDMSIPDYDIGCFTFESLLQFRSLHELILRSDAWTPAISPRDIISMGRTWSSLTRLQILAAHGGLLILPILAEHLPLLRVLGYHLDLQLDDLLEAEKVNPVKRLQHLEVFYTGFSHRVPHGVDVSRIASVIAAVCPPGFRFCFRLDEPRPGSWARVQTKEFDILKEAVERAHQDGCKGADHNGTADCPS